jgi:hypothetical protein|tara:strand:+ start:1378 stop:1491 length:114 start_codon:yes stop_codon:yes gene_type:complete
MHYHPYDACAFVDEEQEHSGHSLILMKIGSVSQQKLQ